MPEFISNNASIYKSLKVILKTSKLLYTVIKIIYAVESQCILYTIGLIIDHKLIIFKQKSSNIITFL